MTGKKRVLSAVICAVMLVSLAVPAAAANNDDVYCADVLNTLGLVYGSDKGYELYREPTRVEMLCLIVRLYGGEAAAASGGYSHPFTDVPVWAEGYIGYGYEQGLIKGVTETAILGETAADARDFYTALLRVMGYSDSEGDFTWETAVETAYRLGIADRGAYSEFLRGDMFRGVMVALKYRVRGTDMSLAEKLAESGAVKQSAVNALGLASDSALSAREISERCGDAVFLLTAYESAEAKAAGEELSTASGFFITEDGYAITNCHSINGCSYADITLPSGEVFEIDGVVYFDSAEDFAIIKVENRDAVGRKVFFPYLETLDSGSFIVGDTVFAIGCPLGLSQSLSVGIISGIKEVDGIARPIIQNTASISKGSSGGALINEYGQAIGVTTGYFTYGNDMYISINLDPLFENGLSGELMTLDEVKAALEAETAAAEEQENEEGASR